MKIVQTCASGLLDQSWIFFFLLSKNYYFDLLFEQTNSIYLLSNFLTIIVFNANSVFDLNVMNEIDFSSLLNKNAKIGKFFEFFFCLSELAFFNESLF